jgi:methyl-accepting chemotaxis protein
MNEIVTSITRVTDIMSEITSASVEQSAGIEQVNTAIVQMDQVTQQNAALVEEAAAAAESMQEQAARLSEVVSVFKLLASHTPLPRRRAAQALGAEAVVASARRQRWRRPGRPSKSPSRKWWAAMSGKRFNTAAFAQPAHRCARV